MTGTFSWDIPDDVLALEDVAFAWEMGAPEGVAIAARTKVLDYDSRVLFARVEGRTGRRGVAVGLKPDDWPIGKAIPALSHPAIDGLTLDKVTLVVTDQEARVHSSELSDAARQFYQEVYQTEEFDLVLTPGLNLIAAFPVDKLGADHPLNKLFGALGIEAGVVLLQGTLGESLAAVGKGAASLDLIKDIYLRAMLPPMRPEGSPAWFKSGLLALELTGQPSVGFVGEITVDIEGDILTFMAGAKIAKEGASVAMVLVGGMKAEKPWEHPFDVQWLVLNRVVLKLSVNAYGNIGLGFAADMIIGEKDMLVAIAVALNASGVPTNLIFEGRSDEGFAMEDLVKLQAQMAQARQKAPAPPGPRAGAIPLDTLPAMEITEVHLKFAPRDDPDLGVERGLKLKGELWIEMKPDGGLTNFAGVDFSIDDNGIVAKAHLGAYAIGPVSWDDALLDLELTFERQNLTISGAVDLGFMQSELDVSVTKQGFFFETEATIFGRFQSKISADAPLDLDHPLWTARGELDNQFNGEIADLVAARLRAWAAEHARAVDAAKAAARAARKRADQARARLKAIEEGLDARKAEAKQAMESAGKARDAARKARDRAAQARARAKAAYDATPAREARNKAARKAAYAKASAAYTARAAALKAREAEYAAAKAIYDALGSEEVEAARRELEELERTAAQARERQEELERALAELQSGSGTPLVVDKAAFAGRLDALQGGTAQLDADVRILDRPEHLSVEWDFERMERGIERLVGAVLDRLGFGA